MSHIVIFAEVAHCIYLIFHQGYQRRYDYGCTLHQQRWKLITQGFAATGRHEHKCVVAIHEVAYDSFLIAFKIVKTEM